MTKARYADTRVLGLAAVLALVAAAVAFVLVPGAAPTAQPGPVLGVYAGSGDPTAVGDFAATLGGQPHYAMDFIDGRSWRTITASGWQYSRWQGKGYTMIWGVDMLPDTYTPNSNPSVVGGSCDGLARGATGGFDRYFHAVGQNIVLAGFAHSIIRLGWEFNGSTFPWAAKGCASAFVTYFDAIVATMRSVPGEQFTFEWNPTRGDLGVGDLAQYYPGDTFVDYVGLDVYDVEWQRYPGAHAEFETMATQRYGLDWLASFAAAHDKPMVLPEWGLGWGTCSTRGQPVSAPDHQSCGGDDAPWVNLMADWIAAHNVSEATYWDYGTSSVDSGRNPSTAAALATDFAKPR